MYTASRNKAVAARPVLLGTGVSQRSFLRAMSGVIAGGVKETAGRRRRQNARAWHRPAGCFVKPARIRLRLVKRYQGVAKAGMVVEKGVVPGPARSPAVQQSPPIVAQVRQEEVGGGSGGRAVTRLVEHVAGPGHGVDHEPVPTHEHLVVAAGSHARATGVKHLIRSADQSRSSDAASRPRILAQTAIGLARCRMLRPSKLPASDTS